MTFDEIKELIAVINEADIAEMTVETDDVKLKIKKGAAFVATSAPPAPVVPVGAPANAPSVSTADAVSETVPPAAVDDNTHVTIVAPMVGTFYRAPSPDSDPYVKTGESVDVGQPLCIIEAMKLMNEIESEVQGRIKEILVENGQPVEYGQPLFIIERA